MLTYNSLLSKLVMPEYGRNVQQMVEHCLTIEDREERNRCAYTIVQNMANMFPQLRAETDYQHKLWDHLMIMSGFQLDVDFPFDDIIREENLDTKPDPIRYELEPIIYRHYGKNIERMIERAAEYPEGEERDALDIIHRATAGGASRQEDGVERVLDLFAKTRDNNELVYTIRMNRRI